MQIFVAQLNPLIGAIEQNCAAILRSINEAKRLQCDMIVFPEMALCGYTPQDLLFQKGFVEACEEALESIIPQTVGITAIIGLVRKAEGSFGKPLRNSAAIIEDGRLLGFQDKYLLPTYDVFDEWRYFEPAKSERIWDLVGKKVGITICEDMWVSAGGFHQQRYEKDPLENFEKKGIDLFVNLSASPYSLGKIQTRKRVIHLVAKRLECDVLVVNQVGAQDGLIFDGSSICVSAHQKTIFQAPRFAQAGLAFHLHASPLSDQFFEPSHELFEALCLGVQDYFVKQGFHKACIGLSGGIDSSVVACIAVEALGKENVLGVLLPSRFTARSSREDAQKLAQALGIQTKEMCIEESFTALLHTLDPHTGADPLVCENLQSRIRGILLMALSNKEGYLLLNTGNKSELAVGYTTLYGDACGAIGVIADLLKGQVYDVGRWVNRNKTIIPESVFTKAPSAELRPDQKDSDSLPEYHLLDVIVDEYIVQQKSCEDIVACHRFDTALVKEIITRIHASEYKRRQVPFALRVSDKSFSYGRKVPIAHYYKN